MAHSFRPSSKGSTNSSSSHRGMRQPVPHEDVPKGTSPNIRSRRRRRQRRHASSVGSDSSQTTSSSSSSSTSTPDFPPISQLYSFPLFRENGRENGNAFQRHATRFFSHVTRLVRGGTALIWKTTTLPSASPVTPSLTPLLTTSSTLLPSLSFSPFSSPSSSPSTSPTGGRRSARTPPPPLNLTLHIVDDDDVGDYAKAICLPTPRLGAQAIPISSTYDFYNSDMAQSVPMLVFPPIDCGKPCCGSH